MKTDLSSLKYLTFPQIAEVYGAVGRKAIERLVRRGVLHRGKVGVCYRYSAAELDAVFSGVGRPKFRLMRKEAEA